MKKQLVLLILINNLVFLKCKSDEVYSFENNNPICKSCPENCEVCELTLNKEIECLFCKQGSYSNDKKECKKCAEHCQGCSGPYLEDCHTLEHGYYFNYLDNMVEKCKMEGCSLCFSDTYCLNCQEGFFSVAKSSSSPVAQLLKKGKKKEKPNPEVVKVDNKSVECFSCGIKDCLYCAKIEDQIKNVDYIKCSLCKQGLSLQGNKCVNCPDNCSYCQEGSMECSSCDEGYFLNKEKNKCDKIEVDNCFNAAVANECVSCESHYYLTEDKKCKSCSDSIENCEYCNFNSLKKELYCYGCFSGFNYDETTKKCEKCMENCEYCRKQECTFCSIGYYYDKDNNICKTCEMENCAYCSSKVVCDECHSKYYFDQTTKKCEKCEKNCLTCSNTKDNCNSCPINYFKMSEDIVIEKKQNIDIFANLFLGGIMNNIITEHKEIKTKLQCLEKCPEQHEGKRVLPDFSQMTCLISSENEKVPEKNVSAIYLTGDIHERILKLKQNYNLTIQKLRYSKLERISKKKSEDCNFNGIVKREIRGIFDNYEFCICDKDYLGDFCDIPVSLYKSVQIHLGKILNEMAKSLKVKRKHKIKMFLKSLEEITAFHLSLAIIQKVMNIIVVHLQDDPELDNKEKLFLIYDKLLLRLLEERDDQKKVKNTDKEEENFQEKKIEVIEEINGILQLLENSFEENFYMHSFLETRKETYIAFDTQTFNMIEYKIKNYVKDNGFIIANPSINNYYHLKEGPTVYFDFEETIQVHSSIYHFQIINLDSQLFESKLENFKGEVLVTNLLYFKFINPIDPTLKVFNSQVGIEKITIKFSLLYMPAYENVLDHIRCKALYFEDDQISIEGEALKLIEEEKEGAYQDEDEEFIICQFDAHFPLSKYYFAITMIKTI